MGLTVATSFEGFANSRDWMSAIKNVVPLSDIHDPALSETQALRCLEWLFGFRNKIEVVNILPDDGQHTRTE